jgi:hypothetical protein
MSEDKSDIKKVSRVISEIIVALIKCLMKLNELERKK